MELRREKKKKGISRELCLANGKTCLSRVSRCCFPVMSFVASSAGEGNGNDSVFIDIAREQQASCLKLLSGGWVIFPFSRFFR